MVVSVGYHFADDFITLYNFQTNEEKTINVEKLDPNNVETIDKLFQTIRANFTEKIDCFCIFFDPTYNNEFRKKFVEISENKYNVQTVRIIGLRQAQLYCSIMIFSSVPENGEQFWISCFLKDYFALCFWEFDKIYKWKLKKNHETNEKKYSDSDWEIENSSKKPHIFILDGISVINKEDLENFSRFGKVYYNEYKISRGVYEYAQNYFKENIFSYYQSDAILEKCFRVISKDERHFMKEIETLFYIEKLQILPLSINVDFDARSGNYINLYEFSTNESLREAEERISKNENALPNLSLPIQKDGNYKITLNIDINGIYTLDLRLNKESEKFFYIPKKLSSFDPTHNAIGIDFGTTECCAAVIRKNGPDFVQLDPVTSNRTMPSYVAFDEKEPKCGQIVVDRMRYKAEYSVYDIKRIIGKSFDEIIVDKLWPFKTKSIGDGVSIIVETFDGENIMTSEKISATLLQHIKAVTEVYQGNILKEAVITIPCSFTAKQKAALETAAKIAGWEIVHFIPEPVAATFAYFTETSIPNESNILICDCGGGTVDICIAKVNNGKIEILTFDGDPYLGGRDFDRLLFNHFHPILKHKYGIDVMENSKKFILKQKCQDIKHNLSVAMDHWLDVSDFDFHSNDIIKITRDEFETMATDLLLRIKNIICQAYIKSNLQKNKIDFVFQVGGGCRMPMIKDLLKEIFPNAKHQCTLYPDWVVAHGAALYAYSLKSDNNDESEDKKQPHQVEKKRSLFDKIFKK